MEARKVFENLAEKGLFITSGEDFEETNSMFLKNEKDEVLFKFNLIKGVDTLTSLKMRIDRLKAEVESCF